MIKSPTKVVFDIKLDRDQDKAGVVLSKFATEARVLCCIFTCKEATNIILKLFFISNSLKPVVRSSDRPAKSPLGPKGPSHPQELE